MKASAPPSSTTVTPPPPGLGISGPRPPPGFTGIPLNSNVVEAADSAVNLWATLPLDARDPLLWIQIVFNVILLFLDPPRCPTVATWCQRISTRGTWSSSNLLKSTWITKSQSSTSSKTTLHSSDRYRPSTLITPPFFTFNNIWKFHKCGSVMWQRNPYVIYVQDNWTWLH